MKEEHSREWTIIWYVTYKRVEGVAVGRDRGDKDCRPRDRGRKPVERGPDDAQAGTVENRIGPAIRKRRQSRYVCWYPRVSQSCITREFLLVFSRAWIVPKKIHVSLFYGRFFLSAVDNVVDAVIDWYFEWETEKRKETPVMFLLTETGLMNLKKSERKKEKKKIEEVKRSVGNGDYSPWQGKDL